MHINDINSALQAYNRIDDALGELRLQHEKREKILKDKLDEVEQFLLAEMKEKGISAFESPGQGLCKIQTKRRFGCGDWGNFWNWLVQNNRPDMLQKRLLDSAVAAYLETTGELPPAVNSEAKLIISVTKRPK